MRPLEKIVDAIHEADAIALVSHLNPDGDTMGSALALKNGDKSDSKKQAFPVKSDKPSVGIYN